MAGNNALGAHDGATEYNSDIADALRNQTGKLLDTIVDIEEKIEELADAFQGKLQAFTQEKISLLFSRMSVFSGKSLLSEEAERTPLFRVDGDENRLIACFRLHQDTARSLLTITLGGHDTSTDELGEDGLRSSELKLFALLVDYLMSGFFECMEVDETLGVPRKPQFAENEDFLELAETMELVAFAFEFAAGEKTGSLELVVPLEAFENDTSERAEKQEQERARQQEQIWLERLHERIEQVELPHSIEIGCSDMPLANVATLEVGQQLDIALNLNNARIVDDSGMASFVGKISISENVITLQVTGSQPDKGV